MKKLLVVCGPTATGKTALGIKLAKKFSGEIVSADSRQVYKGMDIGTGKDIPKNSKVKIPAQFYLSPSGSIRTRLEEQFWAGKQNSKLQIGYYLINGVKVWLLDVVGPDYQFSVADYVKCANLVIQDIWDRNKLPVLVGGTGFYIKGVVEGIETMGIPQDRKLRKELSNYPIIQLSNLLKKTDKKRWEKMNESDRKNPRRLVRAIEIAIQNQKLNIKNQKYISKLKIDRTLLIGLTAPNKILYQRIDKRVDERVKQGIVGEIKGLLRTGYSWENSVLGETIGYKEWEEYFTRTQEHKNTRTKLKKEIIQKWKYNEHGYARRQMTWFKNDKRISWFDILKKGWENEVTGLVNNWVSTFRPPSEESPLRQRLRGATSAVRRQRLCRRREVS